MTGKSILHYKIIEKLGEGGMGIVYLAEDTKLKRQVAIKFLPNHIAANSDERKRFEIEAQAAAALNHHNIATIYAIEETDDHIFLVMEYIEGRELKSIINNQLPARSAGGSINNALGYAIQIAAGLQTAHEKGIIHRDIKSSNIMVTEKGTVKIMDFGLAKFRGSAQLTQIGTTVGTAAYMSPEQARGEDTDQRSDIWSFGVVLYEMLSGTLPFKGDYEQAVIFNILNEEPPDFNEAQSDVPDNIGNVVLKCLQKNPADRYQNVSQVIDDLKSPLTNQQATENVSPAAKTSNPAKWIWSAVAIIIVALIIAFFTIGTNNEPQERIPIAVIDFDNQTGEAELDGLSGLLITAMEQSQRLKVITRSRMLDVLRQSGNDNVEYIDEKLGREICKQTHLEALAMASIRKLGNIYAIDLKVLDPVKDEYLFTAKEEGQGQESIFTMIDDLAEKTRSGLKEKVEQIQQGKQKVADAVTTNLEAYQHYFIGEELISSLKFKEAEEEFRKAVAIDTAFTQAWYRLAYSIAWWGGERAKKPIQKALQFINNVPEKERLYILSMNEIIEGNISEAIGLYKKILRKYPDEKEALYQVGDWAFHQFQSDTAIIYLKKVLALDPFFERAYQHIIWTYLSIENYNVALEFCRNFVANVQNDQSYFMLGETYARNHDIQNAIETFKKALEVFPSNPLIITGLGETYIFADDYKKSAMEFSKLIQNSSSLADKSTGYQMLAVLNAYQGKYSETIRMMDMKISIDKELRDNVAIAADHSEKALWLLAGAGNLSEAEKEINNALQYKKVYDENAVAPIIQCYLLIQKYQEIPDLITSFFNSEQVLVKTLEAHIEKSNRQYDQAISSFQKATYYGNYRFPPDYELALLYFELGQYDNALKTIKKMQNIFRYYHSFNMRSIQYPKSFYLLGQIYEKLNYTKSAIKSYQKVLDLWQDADKDIQELIETKKRLANLKRISIK